MYGYAEAYCWPTSSEAMMKKIKCPCCNFGGDAAIDFELDLVVSFYKCPFCNEKFHVDDAVDIMSCNLHDVELIQPDWPP